MNALLHNPPVLGIAAWSGTGKTTLLTKLLPLLRAQGLRVGMLKHAHHAFDINPVDGDVSLWDMLAHLDRGKLDLILVEGFKHERFPKLELHRAAVGKPLLFPDDDAIIAIASDTPVDTALSRLDINDPEAVAAFIVDYCNNDIDPTGL
ncbi:MAG: molybdopterin-guanine dinucleotide biosynthesis protein MobB [Gammaproteobacteria bacterium]|nr:molybdopterin-guanine dinucleotide biosynthesis protein MobB [Gammaproteobacteria bacterium]